MHYITLPGTTLNVSKLCLGTMTFGEQNTQQEAHEQLTYAIEQGVNFIDTAEMYPVPANPQTQGLTEQYIGEWLQHQRRDALIIASKVSGPNRGMPWIRGGPQFTREQIHAACDASLKRLKTDYLDLYQLHWPARHVPMFGQTYYEPTPTDAEAPCLSEQLAALAELVQAGKVRYIGVSNETPWGVMECKRLSAVQGLPQIATIQNVYNLINRNYDHGLSEVCQREAVSLLAYSPLAFGLLSGKYHADPQAEGRMTRFSNFGQRYLKPHVNPAVAAYTALAAEHQLSPAQLALAWMQSCWFVASTIIGASTMPQLVENLASRTISLSDDLLAKIEAIHRQCPSPAQ